MLSPVETLSCSVAQPVCDGKKSNNFDSSTLADLNEDETSTSSEGSSSTSAKDKESASARTTIAVSVQALALVAAFLALH